MTASKTKTKFAGVRRLTPTESLKNAVQFLKEKNDILYRENAVLKAENTLYKQFNDLHFKQGIPSLIKALRVAIWTLASSKK